MAKYLTVYQPKTDGTIKKIETVDGEPMPEGWGANHESKQYDCGFFSWLFASFSKSERRKYKRPTDGNGREYDGENWVYTSEANGDARPTQCNYEAPQDYQGSVPVWDGYNGE